MTKRLSIHAPDGARKYNSGAEAPCRHACATLVRLGVYTLLLLSVLHVNARAQLLPAYDDETPCHDARDLVRRIAIRQGVPAGVMAIESIRQTDAYTISRYSVVMTPLLTPEELFRALSEATQNAGFSITAEVPSELRLLIIVSADGNPCVEILCVLLEPLSSLSFMNSPPPESSATTSAIPQEAEPVPTPPVDMEPIHTPREEATPIAVQIKETEETLEHDAVLTNTGVPNSQDVVSQETHRPTSSLAPVDTASGESVERQPPLGKIAIILDDGGYGGEVTTRVLELDNRIALAILPDTRFAESTAAEAIENGFDIMLHMPMETNSETKAHAFPGELTLDMTREEIHERARECIAQFPDAIGVNNHTGAGFSMDDERIGWFLEVVKENGLFFLDSRTTWKSCAYDVARAMNVPCARRDIFLDNSSNPNEIRNYFDKLIEHARDKGCAIGIGHFRSNTVTVLEEVLPTLEELNIELVRISELIKWD